MQKDRYYHAARVVLGEANDTVCQATRSALLDHGFRAIYSAPSAAHVEAAMNKTDIDLLICDADLSGRDFCETVHLARHHKTGENPFVVVIATTDDPSPANVRRILDSGVDDIILKPLRIRPLLERIERQITERKHFVVTHRYIGPDRRDGTRKDEAHPIPSIPVPNTLRATVVNQTNRIRLRELINAVWHQVNEHKMERHSAQIAWLVERLLPTLRQDIIDNVVKERLALLQETAMELSLRVKSSRFDHVSGLAVSLIEVARSLRDCPPPPDRRTIDLLPNLSNAITTAFGSFDKTVKTSHEISHAVQQHTWPQGKTNLHN